MYIYYVQQKNLTLDRLIRTSISRYHVTYIIRKKVTNISIYIRDKKKYTTENEK